MLKNDFFFNRILATISVAVATGFVFGGVLSTPGAVSAQTTTNASQQQAVMKIEESTHKLTQENQETEQIIVSKIYDTQDPLGNSYLLRVSGGNKAVVIDPGYNYEAIVKYLGGLHVDVEAILLTNGNFIRIAGNEELLKKWPKATILVGEQDAGLLTDPKANMSSEFGGVTSPIANVWLKDGDSFEIAGMPVSVIGTPGFSPGSMTYVLATDDGTIAFTGDFIYKEGISSANMPSSNEADLHKSLDHFLETQFAETLVFPGHGENTSLSEFYQKMTGNSISVIPNDASQAGNSNSPIIIVERDPATAVLAQPVYVPMVEYRTETIYVERYERPWVSVGVAVPLYIDRYRPWNNYYYYRPVPLPTYRYQPYPGWSLYFGYNPGLGGLRYPGRYYPPPLVAPPRPGRLVAPPGFVPPVQGYRPPVPVPPPGRPGDSRPNRPGPGVPPGGGRPIQPMPPGGGRPIQPMPPGGGRPIQPMPPGGGRPIQPTPPGGGRVTPPATSSGGGRPIQPTPPGGGRVAPPATSSGGGRVAPPATSSGGGRSIQPMPPGGGRTTPQVLSSGGGGRPPQATPSGGSSRPPQAMPSGGGGRPAQTGRPSGRGSDGSQDSSSGSTSRRDR